MRGMGSRSSSDRSAGRPSSVPAHGISVCAHCGTASTELPCGCGGEGSDVYRSSAAGTSSSPRTRTAGRSCRHAHGASSSAHIDGRRATSCRRLIRRLPCSNSGTRFPGSACSATCRKALASARSRSCPWCSTDSAPQRVPHLRSRSSRRSSRPMRRHRRCATWASRSLATTCRSAGRRSSWTCGRTRTRCWRRSSRNAATTSASRSGVASSSNRSRSTARASTPCIR